MNGYGSRESQTPQGKPPSPKWDVIMGEDLVASAKELVRSAEVWGRYLKDRDLKTSQIRNIFSEVRRIEMSWPSGKSNPGAARDLVLLEPKLSYQAARNKPVKPLAEILIPGIERVKDDRDRFQRFVDFFEAVLAYHKAAGGK